MSIKLSDLARRDLDEIRHYTLDQWGRKPWLKYFKGLTGAFETIVEFPEKGRTRELFYPGMRSINYQHHVIFYMRFKAHDNAPVILRILHRKRNMAALLYYENLEG